MGKSIESGSTPGSGVDHQLTEKDRRIALATKTSTSSIRDKAIKYGALALLVLQNTFLVVFMRYSRTVSASSQGDEPKYSSATAVFCMEVTSTCFVVDIYAYIWLAL
jgi:hypothetical protein